MLRGSSGSLSSCRSSPRHSGCSGTSRTLSARFGRLVLGGAGLLVAAVALEALSPALFWLGFDHGDLVYELEVVAEEGAELGGWALIATACLAAAVDHLQRPTPSSVTASAGALSHRRCRGSTKGC